MREALALVPTLIRGDASTPPIRLHGAVLKLLNTDVHRYPLAAHALYCTRRLSRRCIGSARAVRVPLHMHKAGESWPTSGGGNGVGSAAAR
jgi:hypothetical protein